MKIFQIWIIWNKFRVNLRQEKNMKQKQMLKDLLNEIDSNDPKVVKLGDASIAAPFSYKLSGITAGTILYLLILSTTHFLQYVILSSKVDVH